MLGSKRRLFRAGWTGLYEVLRRVQARPEGRRAQRSPGSSPA
jgi:hypothetical protein